MRTEKHDHQGFLRYFRRRLPVAAAAAAVAVGAAAPASLACPAHTSESFWERALGALAADPATAASGDRAAPKPAPAKRNATSPRLRWITGSRYVRTTHMGVMRQMGCRAGQRRQNGLVVLAFGKPYYNGHSYGTVLFSNRFASNAAITKATRAYAAGYASCLPPDSPAMITLARGTSNYDPSVPSMKKAGRKWSRETMQLAKWLREHPGVAEHVKAAAAIDAEPGWDRAFHRTRDFFMGFRAARTGYLLYNFGSLDGGVGAIWNLRQAFYVAGGMRYARVVPEIYFESQAKQWAELARLAQRTYGRSVQFAGVMTQHAAGCGTCGMTPLTAHRTLKRELSADDTTRELAASLASVTNIN